MLVVVHGIVASDLTGCTGNREAADRSKTRVRIDRKAIIGPMPVAIMLDRDIDAPAKVLASIMWAASHLEPEGRRVVPWGVKHCAGAMGCCFNSALKYVQQLVRAQVIAKVSIAVPDFGVVVPGYWLGTSVVSAVKTRNAARKGSTCRQALVSEDGGALGSPSPARLSVAPAAPHDGES